MDDALIETMLLKGAGLVLRYYRDYGLRPMADIDVLVPAHQASAATAALRRLRFAPIPESLGARTETEVLALGYELEFVDTARQQVDLHWHVFYQRLDPRADAELWADAIPISIKGVPTHTSSAADQLLHVCVHGTQMWWDGRAELNLRWIADAMAVLQTASTELDWDRLLMHAQRYRFVLPLRETLEYLRDVFDARIPHDFMQRLRTQRVSRAERIVQRASTRAPELWGPWLALGVRYLEYSTTLPVDAGFLQRLSGLPGFLRRRWKTSNIAGMAFAVAFRGMRRLGWVVRAHWRRLIRRSPSALASPARTAQ